MRKILTHRFFRNKTLASEAHISAPTKVRMKIAESPENPCSSRLCKQSVKQRSHGMTGGIPRMLGIWSLCENNSACGTDARGRLSCCGALPSALNCETIMITFCMGCHLVTLVASLCLSALSQVLVI